jgi:hypothetical protein
MIEVIGIVLILIAPLVAVAAIILGLFRDEIKALFYTGDD